MPDPAHVLKDESVREQVRRITESPLFSQSDRLKQFLIYVTQRTLDGREGELKESVLAMDVFGRIERPEGGADSLVRVTASKVRSKLREYYLGGGSQDAILIELPRGTYIPVFHDRTERQKAHLKRRWILAAGGSVVVLLAAPAATRLVRRPPRPAPRQTDPATYELFVQGSHYSRQFTEAGRNKSIDLLRKAINRDPLFVPAYVTLAETHLNPPELQRPWEIASEARVLLAKALELEPMSADAIMITGLLKYRYDWNWPDAERCYRQAVALNPDADPPHQRLAEFLAYAGRTDEAIHEAKLGLTADPVSNRTLTIIALANYLGRRPDRALESARRIIEVHPNSLSGHLMLGVINAGVGNATDAITALERLMTIHKDPAPLGYLGALGHAYARAGRRVDAMRMLHQLEEFSKRWWVSPIFLARIYVGLGMNEQALDLLDRSFEQHDPNMVWVKLDPRMDPIRDNVRFKALLRRLPF